MLTCAGCEVAQCTDSAMSSAGAFAVGPGHAPNAVRLALSSPPTDTLSHALDVLAELAHGTPDDAGPD
ncbi:hypothetical protein [Streptomyces sp. NPDC097640]|uniref:hypothetical protein n=1 Tax=Streptomyces sp. NPDC097640 TaxID=3157229 RepID=UPI00332BBFDE